MKIIGYSSIDNALITAPGNRINISHDIALVLKKRGCAGRWEGDKYIPCDSGTAPYCDHCCGLPDPCIMCRGECRKTDKTCDIGHSVYLAIFSPGLVKVGISRTWRLETRLMEQGADVGLEIGRFPDGELARKRERGLASLYPDRATFENKLDGIAQKVSGEVLQKLCGKYEVERVLQFDYFKEDLWMKPILLAPHENMALSGRVLGVKGQVLVIEKGNSLYAVNLDGLIGYEAETGTGSIILQTSLLEFPV